MRNNISLFVAATVLMVVSAYFYTEYQAGKVLTENALYYQVTGVLNEGEVDAWLNNTDGLDVDPFLDVDYNIINSVWLEGPHISGESIIKVGRFKLYIERTPATDRRTGHWERSR